MAIPQDGSVQGIIDNNTTVYGSNGTLHINTTESVAIYNAQGVLVAVAHGDTTIKLARGLYIVNNKKVLVF